MHKKQNFSAFNLYVFLILVAFEILMSFTFLGYIHIGPFSITFAYIPVLVAACFLGPVQSTAMGLIFGLASMYKATCFYTMWADRIFSPWFSSNPFGSFVMCVGARVLFGLLAGIAYDFAKKRRRAEIWIGVLSSISPIVHAWLVMMAMYIYFPSAVYGYTHAKYLYVSNIVSIVASAVLMVVLWRLYDEKKIEKIKVAIDGTKDNPTVDDRVKRKVITVFTVFAFCMTIVAALYFSNRTSYMLRMHNIDVSDTIDDDLIHLQIQFTLAAFSLNVISIIVLIMGYSYTSYRNFMSEFDTVTNVMGRRIFQNCCERIQRDHSLCTCVDGWFLFLDVDHFKKINDSLGHASGDKVLREIAQALKNIFYDCGIVGRMGGDEFAVMIDKVSLSEAELRKMLDVFFVEIAGASCGGQRVTCSVGACHFSFPEDMTMLMKKTDTLLYKAKENGRNCYVLGEFEDS